MLYTINRSNHSKRPNGALVVDKTTGKVVGYAPAFSYLRGCHIDTVKLYCKQAGWELSLFQSESEPIV